MAFCTKCGKQLQDGEVCSCQTQAAPQPKVTPVQTPVTPVQTPVAPAQPSAVSGFFKVLWTLILNLFKEPATTINSFVAKAELKFALVFIGINAVVASLVRWFGILQTNSGKDYSDYSNYSLSDLLGGLSSYTNTSSPGYIAKQMLFSMLYVIVSAVVVAVIIMLFASVLGKVKMSFAQSICIASLPALFIAPARLIDFIFGLFKVGFFTELGNDVAVFASAAGSVLVFLGIKALCKNENKIPYIAGLASAISALSVYIVGLLN